MAVYKRKGAATYTSDFWHKSVRFYQDTGQKTEKDARQWERQKKKEVKENWAASRLSTKERLNLKEAAARFIEEHLQFSDGFEASEKYRLAKVIERLGENKLLEDLTTGDVKGYVARRQGQDIAPSTINREITNIRALWGHAMEIWEYPVHAIAWRRVRPKIPKRLPPEVSSEELARLVAAATPRLKKAIQFTLLTGFRRHEVRKLAPKNVNLERQTIRIIGKGNNEAMVPISSATVSLLLSVWDEKSSTVFDMTNFRREWDDARTMAGLKHLRFHDLRHAFATILSELNAPVQHIKDGLRHSDIDTTLIYTHAGAQALSPFLEKLGDKLLESWQDK